MAQSARRHVCRPCPAAALIVHDYDHVGSIIGILCFACVPVYSRLVGYRYFAGRRFATLLLTCCTFCLLSQWLSSYCFCAEVFCVLCVVVSVLNSSIVLLSSVQVLQEFGSQPQSCGSPGISCHASCWICGRMANAWPMRVKFTWLACFDTAANVGCTGVSILTKYEMKREAVVH